MLLMLTEETAKKRKRRRSNSMKVATANSYVAGIRKDTLGITSKRGRKEGGLMAV